MAVAPKFCLGGAGTTDITYSSNLVPQGCQEQASPKVKASNHGSLDPKVPIEDGVRAIQLIGPFQVCNNRN